MHDARVVLSMALPRGGPVEGGTEVCLLGQGFLQHGRSAFCDFGGNPSPLTWLDTAKDAHVHAHVLPVRTVGSPPVACRAPSAAVAGTILVRLSVDGAWIAGSSYFRYYDVPEVRELFPSVGPANGGSLVLIIGIGFGPYPDLGDSVALCRFGSAEPLPPIGGGGGADSRLAVSVASLRTHQPRFVTTPASVLHRGAMRCRAPTSFGLGIYPVQVGLNGRDFSRVRTDGFRYYDNWMRPRIGGVSPTARGAHAATRLDSSLWLFGGWGESANAAGGWSDYGAGLEQKGASRELEGRQGRVHELHNDLNELRTGRPRNHYPTTHAPGMIWLSRNYSSHELMGAGRPRKSGGASTSDSSGVGSRHAFAWVPTAAPRARSGHTLTAISLHLVLLAGEAADDMEFPVSEHFSVQGLQMAHGSLEPRSRGQAGGFSPRAFVDPVSEVYQRSSEFLDAFAPLATGALELPTQEATAGAERATEGAARWLEEPTWEANEPTMRFHMTGESVVRHSARRDVRGLRRDLDTVDTAEHMGSELHVQRVVQLDDVHVYDVGANSWMRLAPNGPSISPRTGHAACAVMLRTSTGATREVLVVFGGWRQTLCGLPKPCGEFLNDVHILHIASMSAPSTTSVEGGNGSGGRVNEGSCCTQSRWEAMPVDGKPPMPRRGHMLTLLSLPQGGSYNGGDADEAGDAVLVVTFGLGWLWNATTSEGVGTCLNDVHVLHLANRSWYPLYALGAAPSPRHGHSATLSPDRRRVVVFGGMNALGAMADAHMLDLSDAREPIWWQLQPSGEPPSPRYAHSATLFGTDLLVIGGLPPVGSGRGAAVELLSLATVEMQTSAVLSTRLHSDPVLNASCSLELGSHGSPVQRWSCRPTWSLLSTE